MHKMKMDDDFQSYLTEGAIFEGEQDIPCMLKFSNIRIPKELEPYTLRKTIKKMFFSIVLYMIFNFQI